MHKLTERDIIVPFIGKPVNPEAFTKVSSKNRIRISDYIDDPKYCELFGITDRLKELWEYSGVEFTMHLTVENGVIEKGYIDKLSERGSCHGRPTIKVLSISQQELRVARRVLQYITKF